LTYLGNVRCDGRMRAAGCSPKEMLAAVPAARVRHAPKKQIVPLILAALSKRRQWSPRSMKLAISAVIEHHHIQSRDFAAVIGMEESALLRALVWELDVANVGYLAAFLGYEPRGPQDFKGLRAA